MSNINRDEIVKRKLESAITRAFATRKKVADNMLKSINDAEYQLRWLETVYEEVYYARLANIALEHGIESAYKYAVDNLDSWSPGASSSLHANACRNEEFNALRQFIRDFRVYIEGHKAQ
jgi:hypothetical protein